MTQLKVEVGYVAVVSLASPEESNALDDQTTAEFAGQLKALAANDDVAAVILRNDGGIFSSGGRLDMVEAMRVEVGTDEGRSVVCRRLRRNVGVIEQLMSFPKPVIAALNGPCVGAALGWAGACHIRLASDRSSFNTAYVNLGIGTDFGVSWILSRLIGPGRAEDWLLRPRKISAHEALEVGFVGSVSSEGELNRDARQVAEHLAQVEPKVLSGIRQGVEDGRQLTLSRALDNETERFIESLRFSVMRHQ
ncbi:enoyl-CoA hydratase/isomerase family protein [Ancrocorticia sp.]|uniref:enoyl-CoA hydratase/isomerase family protein n=1 Tax=Ancrocorticia sp. TaxID=2593684 RepID=UPI003F937490